MLKRIFLLLLLVLPIDAFANKTLEINTTGKNPLNTREMSGFMDKVAYEALKRIGVRLKTVQLPAARGLQSANSGLVDGEMSRIDGVSRGYPNLIKVPEKIMDWHFTAFSKKTQRFKNGWKDLSQRSVSFINGWKILESNVPKTATIIKVRGPDQLFAMLRKNHTNIIIYEHWSGLEYIQRLRAKDITPITPPLAIKEMFIYLHKKHKKLVPELAKSLRSMKEDGSYQKIFNEILAPFTDGVATH